MRIQYFLDASNRVISPKDFKKQPLQGVFEGKSTLLLGKVPKNRVRFWMFCEGVRKAVA